MTSGDARLVSCHEAVRQMWDYLDRAVSPVDQSRVDEHLARCRRCCGELEFVKHLRTVLASQRADELPPQAIERLERFVEEL